MNHRNYIKLERKREEETDLTFHKTTGLKVYIAKQLEKALIITRRNREKTTEVKLDNKN